MIDRFEDMLMTMSNLHSWVAAASTVHNYICKVAQTRLLGPQANRAILSCIWPC